MRHAFVRMALVLGFLALSLSLPAGDLTLRLGGRLGHTVADALPVEEAGTTLYSAQEAVHETVADTTGVAVPHDYIWVCTGDECVPVDPYEVDN